MDNRMPRINLFTKIVLLLVIMLVPIVGLYFYSNQTSTDVLRNELDKSNANRLEFFQSQVDSNIESITLWPNLLVHDPDISDLKDTFDNPGPYLNLHLIELVKRIQQKLSIQESSVNWKSSLYIYSPSLNRVITDNDVKKYDEVELKSRMKRGWQVSKETVSGEEQYSFSLFTVSPFTSFDHPDEASLVIEVQFESTNMVDMLNRFKSDGRRDPFYYNKAIGVIYNRSADREVAQELVHKLEASSLMAGGSKKIELGGGQYLVNMQPSRATDWWLIDYIPLSDVIEPIVKSNRLFYISVGSLLLMSCTMAYVLYAQVQVPMKQLVSSFRKLKYEDYSIRLVPKGKGEFGYVFMGFNSMVAQIQELFQKVYLEKIHVREARLKQLQSQINPHFFYNCFSFISSMAKLNNVKAVVTMSQNMSGYYRYTMRQERDFVPLSEELSFVATYLDIQKMRMSRLQVEIDAPPWLRNIEIPPLLIQPIVENAILHGIEEKAGEGLVRITAVEEEGYIRIVVEDNGKGMEDKTMTSLMQQLAVPMDDTTGCGLWNVNQRLKLRFGDNAGLSFIASPLGGLGVVLVWQSRASADTEVSL
jgi:two-component system sensor histidine kinase YesM